MKTPDEIKRGLECSITETCKGRDCPYYDGDVARCIRETRSDALALIRQLEAELDAALDPIRGDCAYCAYLPGEMIPDTCFDCANKGYYRWEFRGGKKEG